MAEPETIDTTSDINEDQYSERRREVRRGLKAVEQMREIFANLGAQERPEINGLLESLEHELDALKPPDPRRCKEYLRAVARSKKGLLGIAPEDVALYCRCPECSALRAKTGAAQPSGALEVEAPPDPPAAEA